MFRHPLLAAARLAAPLAAAAIAAVLCAPLRAQVVVTPLAPGDTPAPAAAPDTPFNERTITLENGLVGRAISFTSANSRQYADIVQRRPMPTVTLHAKLFEPRGVAKAPAVIVTPGSGGPNPSTLVPARALTDSGIAVLPVDPFGGRGVRDTIAAQDPFSFAASTWDVFAAMLALEREPGIGATRIGAMGYSRGGVAVLQAALRPLAEAVLGPGRGLRAVVADADNWVSPIQCQACFSAMKPRDPAVTFRLVRDASHGFGYANPMREIPQALHALNAPIVHLDARGVAIDRWTGDAMPGADDRAIAAMMKTFLGRGVRAGTKDDQMADFVRDLVGFYIANLKL
jgi:dienelactone hydrolase